MIEYGGIIVISKRLRDQKGDMMIYTVTFNPSLDYIVSVDDFQLGMTNRTASEMIMPGGKGINVSILLNNLGIKNTALGYIAGFTGSHIEKSVADIGINADFIRIGDGLSRINLKIKNIDGTEINGMGPVISQEKVEELMERLDGLTAEDVLVLAGSIPSSMSDDIYQTIMRRLKGRDVLIAVDATSSLLLNVLEYHPFVIKPNHHELGEIFGVKLTERHQVVEYAKALQNKGARNVLVSMGGMGAVLVSEDGGVYEADAPEGKLKNSVGAGDSMVAGFLAGWLNSNSYEEAFRMSVGAGSASAFSDSFATREEVEEVASRVVVERIDC